MADANEARIKHLEFIQAVISRMNSNSFSIKGWTVTLVSAIFALAAKDADSSFAVVAYFPTFLFWGLDSFYVSQERQYRELFKEAANVGSAVQNFEMNASQFNSGDRRWHRCLLSKTIGPFYGSLALLILVIMIVVLPHISTTASGAR